MKTAMIVDDEEDICDFLSRILTERFEMEVSTALSGEIALEKLKNNDFDICIVDLKLSTAITGLDVIGEIRKKNVHTKVIAMSGYIDVGLRQTAERLGVVDFFEKPRDIQPNNFEAKIKFLLLK